MKDFSVCKRTTHKYEMGVTVFDRQNGKPCLIVGYAGVSLSPAYCVQYEGDPGMAESMPFRYLGESEISPDAVVFSTDADEIAARIASGGHVSNREADFLVSMGRAFFLYDDPESERWTGIQVKPSGDGNPYRDQTGLEEHPGRL